MFDFIKNMDKNITIANKVIGAITVAIFGILIISTASYIGFSKIGSEIEEIAEYQVPINTLITELEKDILEEEILTLELIIASKDIHSKKFKDIEHHIHELEKETDKTIKEAEHLVEKAIHHNKDEKTKSTYKLFLSELKELEKEQEHFKKALKQFEHDLENNHLENIEKEKQIVLNDLKTMEKNIVKLMHQMEDLLKHSTHQAEKDEKAAIKILLMINIAVFIITVIMAIILTKIIKQKFVKFQTGLESFFRYLNRESENIDLLDDSTNDEMGTMSKAINKNIKKTRDNINEDRIFLDDVQSVMDRVERGWFSQHIEQNTQNPNLQQLKQTVNQALQNLRDRFVIMNDTLKEYADYDYKKDLVVEGIEPNGVFDELIKNINILRDSINEMLIQNRSNGLTLGNSSEILLDNVNILSAASNQAAASLEETASALEEITSNISNNTDNISKMSGYAKEVTVSVKEGQNLASQTTQSMENINSEVTAINEAISVIDQIAFQTNILSLNAAVEAATAGEAGKGFAVVAGEVRNLASRSAEAANEIKALVESAKNKADEGKTISDKMISGYTKLNENIENTIDLISDVENASKEQLNGIEQINNAVTELDQQTQQNASVASQTNNIAVQTDEIAKVIIKDTDEKEFIGKDNIQIRSL